MPDRTLFVQSLGRCGSNMLYRACEKVFGDRVWGGHEYPNELKSGLPFRVIFLFRDPMQIVASLKRQETLEGLDWIRNHVRHMGAKWEEYPDLLTKDALGLERLFDAYWQPQRFPLLTVYYDAMWQYPEALAAFIGQPIPMPEYRPTRSANYLSEADYRLVFLQYARFAARLYQLPRIKRWEVANV